MRKINFCSRNQNARGKFRKTEFLISQSLKFNFLPKSSQVPHLFVLSQFKKNLSQLLYRHITKIFKFINIIDRKKLVVLIGGHCQPSDCQLCVLANKSNSRRKKKQSKNKEREILSKKTNIKEGKYEQQ